MSKNFHLSFMHAVWIKQQKQSTNEQPSSHLFSWLTPYIIASIHQKQREPCFRYGIRCDIEKGEWTPIWVGYHSQRFYQIWSFSYSPACWYLRLNTEKKKKRDETIRGSRKRKPYKGAPNHFHSEFGETPLNYQFSHIIFDIWKKNLMRLFFDESILYYIR